MSRKLQIRLYSVTITVWEDSPTVYTADQGTVSGANTFAGFVRFLGKKTKLFFQG